MPPPPAPSQYFVTLYIALPTTNIVIGGQADEILNGPWLFYDTDNPVTGFAVFLKHSLTGHRFAVNLNLDLDSAAEWVCQIYSFLLNLLWCVIDIVLVRLLIAMMTNTYNSVRTNTCY